MRTIVFIDGHNLNHGMLRSSYKWFDLFALDMKPEE